jgi:hypothetical protein
MRTVVAIRIDVVKPYGRYAALTYDEASAEGGLNGHPYAIEKRVFDEDDIRMCSLMEVI